MPTTFEIEKAIPVILSNQLGIESSSIHPTSVFNTDLGCDSLDHVEIMMAVEDHFYQMKPPIKIEFGDDACEKIRTVQDLTDYTTKLVEESK